MKQLSILFCAMLLTPTFSNAQEMVSKFGVGVVSQIHSITFDSEDPDVIYAGGDVAGVFKYNISSNTWESLSKGLVNIHGGRSYCADDLLHVPGSELGGLYAATHGGIYHRGSAGIWEMQTPVSDNKYLYENGLAGLDDIDGPLPVPFSTLAILDNNGSPVILAGAGHARSRPVGLQDEFYPAGEACLVSDGSQNSLWMLQSGGTWNPVSDTEFGLVRQIAIKGTEVALATSTGIYYSYDIFEENSFALIGHPDSPCCGDWSNDFWSVAFDNDNHIYVSTDRIDNSEAGEIADPGIYRYDILTPASGWDCVGDPLLMVDCNDTVAWGNTLEDPQVYFSNMRLVNNPDNSIDLYVGERNSSNKGGFYHAHIESEESMADVEWEHLIYTIGLYGPNSQNYCFLPNGDCGSWDTGWALATSTNPTCEYAVHPDDPNIQLAFIGNVPQLTTDGRVSWDLISAEQPNGWKGLGCEQMRVIDILFDSYNRLLFAVGDYGVFHESASHDTTFKYYDSEPYYDGLGYEVCSTVIRCLRIVDDNHYLTIRSYSGSMLPGYKNAIAFRVGDTATKWSLSEDIDEPVTRDCDRYLTDIEILNETTAFISWADTPRDTVSDFRWKSGIIKGTYDGSEWNWESFYTEPAYVRIQDLLLLPNSNKLLVAMKNGSSQGGDGGIISIDLDSATSMEWLIGESGGTHLKQCARNVLFLATDEMGTVVYAGTSGVKSPNGNERGSVLRLIGPFFNITEDDWEVIGNPENVNSFGFENHPLTGWTPLESAYKMTSITSILVDPRDSSFIYAGMTADRYHPKNGVWKYDGSSWEQILGLNDLPNHPVETIVLNERALPESPTMLVGLNCEDIFEVQLPDITPIYATAKFRDRSEEIYDEGNGVNYAGTPYCELIFDYNNDTRPDLLVTQIDNQVELFEWAGILNYGVPDMDRVVNQQELLISGANGASAGDLDNDGWPDLFITHDSQAKLLRNIDFAAGVQKFENVTQQWGIDPAWLTSSKVVAFCDFDADGQLDILIGRSADQCEDPFSAECARTGGLGNILLHNQLAQTGSFKNVSAQLTSVNDANTRTLSASWCDIDNDGDQDMLVGDMGIDSDNVGNDNTSSLYINHGDGTFAEETSQRIDLIDCYWVTSFTWSDFDRDGDQDLIVASTWENKIFLNDGVGYFVETVFPVPGAYSAIIPLDFDLDNRNEYLCLPANAEGVTKHLYPVENLGWVLPYGSTSDLGVSTGGPVYCAVVADMTEDGDPDLFVGAQTKPTPDTFGKFYYQNENSMGREEPFGNWFTVILTGDGGTNKAAIGAVVTATIDGTVVSKTVGQSYGPGSQETFFLTFGGPVIASEAGTLCEVIWPDGYVQQFTAANRELTEIYDDSGPGYVSGSFTGHINGTGPETADWVFDWDTDYSSIVGMDKVSIYEVAGSGPDCVSGSWNISSGDPDVEHTVTLNPDGSYHHKMILAGACASGCSYSVCAESSNIDEDGNPRTIISEIITLRVRVCLGGF